MNVGVISVVRHSNTVNVSYATKIIFENDVTRAQKSSMTEADRHCITRLTRIQFIPSSCTNHVLFHTSCIYILIATNMLYNDAFITSSLVMLLERSDIINNGDQFEGKGKPDQASFEVASQSCAFD